MNLTGLEYIAMLTSTTTPTKTPMIELYQPIQTKEDINLNETAMINYIDLINEPIKIDYTEESIKKILELSELKNNWDGFGAEELKENVIINSIKFINTLPEKIVKELKGNNITPTPYGTIVYEWDKQEEFISIEVGKKAIGFFTEFNDNKNFISDRENFNEDNLPATIWDAFKKLYKESFL